MNRGDVYMARLDPVEGSEQAGTRPCVIVSRRAINQYSPVLMVTPLADAANVTRPYPSDVPIPAPEAGLRVASVALGGQTRAVSRTRLLRRPGSLWPATMVRIDRTLDLG